MPARKRGSPSRPLVTLRIADGRRIIELPLACQAGALEPLAAEWMYILRNRYRWLGDEDLRQGVERRAKSALVHMGLRDTDLRRVAFNPRPQVEVEFHVAPGKAGGAFDAAACFPWEFVLSAATRQMGRSRPLVVTRLLRRDEPSPTSTTLSRLLFVESAPGRIAALYAFDSERARLAAAISRPWIPSSTETPDELAKGVARRKPEVIHVSGVDNHQAARLLDGFYERTEGGPAAPADGMIMRSASGTEEAGAYGDVADALVSDDARASLWLVTLNLYHSAARLAPACVQRGAYAVLGFLDEIDDELAEYFFQTFYYAWRTEPRRRDVASALGRAWSLLRERGQKLYGTSIVLWLSRSALDAGMRPALAPVSDAAAGHLPDPFLKPDPPTAAQLRAARGQPVGAALQVDLIPLAEVNYSLLHNARPILKRLTLSKLVDFALEEISVTVALNAGDESLPFRYTEQLLTEPQVPLDQKIKLPLTAPLLRSLRERVQSTLYVKVEWDRRIAFEETRSVTLVPVDEWRDDTPNNPWLPSFVLPRDPAVMKVIGSARRHLITLEDDPGAGFDGYQSVDRNLADPFERVDLQVRAIWMALLHEFRLMYVNPPPAYGMRNQRLRTPTEILASGSGTCIDLALLLASCFEYVDISPVIVLLSDHAFVGYWRDDEAHERFRAVAHVPKEASIELGPMCVRSTVPLVDPHAWRLAPQHYEEILGYMQRGGLRFLEATGLSFDMSFADSVKEGRQDMRAFADFDSLFDIRVARMAHPAGTPLPIIEGRDPGGADGSR